MKAQKFIVSNALRNAARNAKTTDMICVDVRDGNTRIFDCEDAEGDAHANGRHVFCCTKKELRDVAGTTMRIQQFLNDLAV